MCSHVISLGLPPRLLKFHSSHHWLFCSHDDTRFTESCSCNNWSPSSSSSFIFPLSCFYPIEFYAQWILLLLPHRIHQPALNAPAGHTITLTPLFIPPAVEIAEPIILLVLLETLCDVAIKIICMTVRQMASVSQSSILVRNAAAGRSPRSSTPVNCRRDMIREGTVNFRNHY